MELIALCLIGSLALLIAQAAELVPLVSAVRSVARQIPDSPPSAAVRVSIGYGT
jgi:RsiW-degrading membrane proteinase PrsW (M82 family)